MPLARQTARFCLLMFAFLCGFWTIYQSEASKSDDYAAYLLQTSLGKRQGLLHKSNLRPGQYWTDEFICDSPVWALGYGTGGASTCSSRPVFWDGNPYNVFSAQPLNHWPVREFNGVILPPGTSHRPDDSVCEQQRDRFPGCSDVTCSVTLQEMSSKYNSEFCVKFSRNFTFPFNERSKDEQQLFETDLLKGFDFSGLRPNPDSHWYEVKLNYDDIEDITGAGRLFSTRIPRNLDKDALSNDNGMLLSDRLSFKANVDLHKVSAVVVLVIDSSLENAAKNTASMPYNGILPGQKMPGLWGGDNDLLDANSTSLFDFYKQLNLTVLSCPFNDVQPPNPEQLVHCIEQMFAWVANGHNIVSHCYGGSGRTGTLLMSLAKTFGVPDVITRARQFPGKSVYLDIHEQELLVDQMPRLWSPFMESVTPSSTKMVVQRRWNAQVHAAAPENIVSCPTGDIVLNSRCQMMANCRACLPPSRSVPAGKSGPRKPAIFKTLSLEATNNYWHSRNPSFPVRCISRSIACNV